MKHLFTLVAATLFFSACSKDEPRIPGPGPGNSDTAKSILSFTFNSLSPAVSGAINGDSITFQLPPGVNVSAQAPTIICSGKATSAPASGQVQDFSRIVTYTVTAGDGSTRKYYAKALRNANVPAPAVPKSLCIYYGWPSAVNGSNGSVAAAISQFSRFQIIVLGDGIEAPGHGDHQKTQQIIAGIKAAHPDILIFGYIAIGNTQNHTMSALQSMTDQWAAMGVDGIFGDEFGFDFQNDRKEQNDFVDYIHSKSLKVIANSFEPDDAMADKNGVASHLQQGDYWLFESALIGHGAYRALAEFKRRADKAYYYMRTKGIKTLVSNTVSAAELSPSFGQSQRFRFAWVGAAMYGAEAFQFTDSTHSSNGPGNTILNYYPSLVSSLGDYWIEYDWVKTVSENQFSRATNTRALSITGDGATTGTGSITP